MPNSHWDTKDVLLLVRIAPYWNVNSDGIELFKVNGKVRIAPYWNVNTWH